MKIICKKTTKRFLGIFAAASMAAGMICTPLMEKKVYAEENSDGKIFLQITSQLTAMEAPDMILCRYD